MLTKVSIGMLTLTNVMLRTLSIVRVTVQGDDGIEKAPDRGLF